MVEGCHPPGQPGSKDTLHILKILSTVLILSTIMAAPACAGWLKAHRITDGSSESKLCLSNARCAAADDSGTVHLVWHDDRTGAYEIYHSTFDGTLWGNQEPITASADYSAEPVIALDSLGLPHVLWQDWRDGNAELYYKRFEGSAWTADQRLTDAERFSGRIAAAFDDSGVLHVVWHDDRDYDYEIYYKSFDGGVWSADLRLTDTTGFSQNPSIATTSGGEVHVVWQDFRDGNYEIYYKFFDGLTWGSDERLTSDAGNSANPSIAADFSDNVHVVWDDNRGGDPPEIYYLKSDGIAWQPEERLTFADGSSLNPSVTADSAGHIHVVWGDMRGAQQEIYYKVFDGISWSGDLRIFDTATQSQYPVLAVDSRGDLNVLWQDYSDVNYDVLWRRRYNGTTPPATLTSIEPDSGGFNQQVYISDLAGTNFLIPPKVWLRRDDEPSTSNVHADNETMVSPTRITCDFDLTGVHYGFWDVVLENSDLQRDTLEAGLYVYPIYAAPRVTSIEPDSGAYGEGVHITDLAGTGFRQPAAAYLHREDYGVKQATALVVVSSSQITCNFNLDRLPRGHWDVIVENPDGQTDTLADAFYVIPMEDPEINSIEPAACAAGEGIRVTELLGQGFVHPCNIRLQKPGEDDIVASAVQVLSPEHIACSFNLGAAATGEWDLIARNADLGADTLLSAFTVLPGMWGPDQQLTCLYYYQYTSGPNARCVAVDAYGNVHAVWYDLRHGYDKPEIYHKVHDGIAWGEDERLTVTDNASSLPSIATDDLGNTHVVWQDGRDGNWEIYYKLHDGVAWHADERLTAEDRRSKIPSLAAEPSGKLHVVWCDYRDLNWEIYYRHNDGSGWLPVERVTTAAGDSYMPAVAVDDVGLVHLVWEDNRSGAWQIYYRMYDGASWSGIDTLATVARYPFYDASVSIAAEGSSMVHVAWHNKVDGTRQVHYRHYDGSAWTPVEMLTTTYSASSFPSVAVCTGGNVHVAWEDERFEEFEIYYRMRTAAGWQPEARLTATPMADESRHPVLGTGHDGRVHLLWYDERNTRFDIFYKCAIPNQLAAIPGDGLPAVILSLTRVFPNPSISGTTITFGIGASAEPVVSIFDVRGRKVWDIDCENLPPGYHRVFWDGTDLNGRPVSPGLYFLRVEAGGQSASAKVVLLR